MLHIGKYSDGQVHIMHIFALNDKMHTHSFFELVYVLNGTAEHILGEERMPLKAGDYFIINPGSEHCYAQAKDFEIVNCLFLPEYIDRALLNCPSLGALLSNQTLRFEVPTNIRTADRILKDRSRQVRGLITQMEEEYSQRRTGYKEQLRCLLTQALVLAVRAAAEAEHPPHPATTDTIAYLQAHLAEPLCLDALSQHCGYAPQYICNLFRKDTGMTISSFLQKLRIHKAQQLLEEGKGTTAEIAQAVGYNDVKHFSQLYRKHTGSIPKKNKKSRPPA